MDKPADTAPAGSASAGYRPDDDRVGSGVRTVGGLTLLSRVFGLARDLTLARLLGDGAVASAFAGAFVVPNLFRRLFGEGALTAAFLPRYSQSLTQDTLDPDASDRYASGVMRWVVVVTGVLALVGVALALGLDAWFGAGSGDRRLALRLTAAMLPFMPMVCASAVLAAIMQARGVFGPAAAAPVLLNTVMIVFALGAAWAFGAASGGSIAYCVAGGVLVAGVGQIMWGLRVLGGARVASATRATRPFRWMRPTNADDPLLRETRRAFVPAAIALGTVQLNAFIDTAIAMWPIWVGPTIAGVAYPLDQSSNALLFYAQRLYQFPLGVFGIAVATVVFPLLSRDAASRDGAFVATLARGLRLSLFIAMPASVGLVLVSSDLASTLFGGGLTRFSNDGVGRVAGILSAYSIGLCAYSANHVLARAFFAQRDTRTPMLIAAWMVALNLSLNLSLMWFVGERALAWSTAASAWAQTLALGWLLRARVGGANPSGAPLRAGDASLVRALLRTGLCCAAMGVTVWLARRVIGVAWSADDQQADDWALAATRLAVSVGVGGAAYLAAARLLRAPEWRWLLSRT